MHVEDVEQSRALLIDDQRRYPYLRPYLREWFDDSLTIVPLLFLIGAILLFLLMRSVDIYLVGEAAVENLSGQTEAAAAISSVIAVAMLSFMGVTFSITLVALQLANQLFSPNIVRKFEGSITVKMAMGTFIATFVFSLLLLREASAATERAQLASMSTALILVVTSVVVFVIFVREILQMMRIAKVIAAIVEDTHAAIDENFPRESAYVLADSPPPGQPSQIVPYLDPPSSILINRAPQGILKAINDVRLLRLAQHHNCTFRVLFRVGDHIMRGDPVVEVYGTNQALPREILAQFVVGHERSMFQDPAFGFRQLVDIASHALASGVNLPSVAALAIDNLTELLLQIARRPAPSGLYADTEGKIRLQRPLLSWEDYVDLAFQEIAQYGSGHPLVQRELTESFDRLLQYVPEGYKPPVARMCLLLDS